MTLRLLDPQTLAVAGRVPAAGARRLGVGNPFQDFTGGGYFYLDDRDRAVIPTSDRRILVVALTDAGPGSGSTATYDLSGAVAPGRRHRLRAARLERADLVRHAQRRRRRRRPGIAAPCGRARSSAIGNSFAIGEDGGVYIVTDGALYRFDAGSPTARRR